MFCLFKRFKMPPQSCCFLKKNCGKCTREVLNIKEINYEKLLELIRMGAVLIDVRTKQEFMEKHLEGAILIPYYEISSKIGDIVQDKNRTIIVYCQNGGRSQRAFKILKRLGYSEVFDLKGGIEGV